MNKKIIVYLLIGFISLPATIVPKESLISRLKQRISSINSDQVKGYAALVGSGALAYTAASTYPYYQWGKEDQRRNYGDGPTPRKYFLTKLPGNCYIKLKKLLLNSSGASERESFFFLRAQEAISAGGSCLLAIYAYKKLKKKKTEISALNNNNRA